MWSQSASYVVGLQQALDVMKLHLLDVTFDPRCSRSHRDEVSRAESWTPGGPPHRRCQC